MTARRRIAFAVAVPAVIVGLAGCGGDEDKVVVPDVEGLRVQAGVDRICGRFLEPALVVADGAAPTEPTTLVGSEPMAGAEVEVGSTVTLMATPPREGVTLFAEPTCDEP